MIWELEKNDKNARAGKLTLRNNEILTPTFMPVGTQACIKALDFNDIVGINSKLILANTYHLYLRPGDKTIAKLGGLKKFSGFNGSFLTDSGGFQAFSLKGKALDEGICFKSHIDGSKHIFTPEKVLDIEYNLDSDIMMILDDLIGLPNTDQRILESINRTKAWAMRSIIHHHNNKELHQNNKIFAIIQGGVSLEARRISSEGLVNINYQNSEFDGFAIGGLAVGEAKNEMYDIIEFTCNLMPSNKPRYLMGVGTPEDLIEGIHKGVDMFDCVMPTRNARNGTIFTQNGRLSIKSARFKEDLEPIDKKCSCYTCNNFSKAYLNHLFKANELLYARLSSIHNLYYYMDLMKNARNSILKGEFENFRIKFYDNLRISSD